MSYSNPLSETITIIYQTTGLETTILRLVPLPGMTGRLIGMRVTPLDTISSGPESIRIGTSGDPDAYGLILVPDGLAPVSNFVRGVVSRIPESDEFELSEAGDSTFGIDIYVSVTIEWS